MITYRSFVGLDVHARTIVGCVIDVQTGEVAYHRFGYDLAEVLAWVASLPGAQTATYEAGACGFGLFRLLTGSGIECVVAAPSKLLRPSGDRVKTDARDAFHLARLLKLGEITVVHVPTVAEETARDLVRSREDTRQDLMASRHRLSKLLLRHGFVYSGGQAWTGKHDVWLRSHRVGDMAFTTAFDASYEAVIQTVARRDRLDQTIGLMAADSQFTPLVNRLGCLRGIGTLTGFGLAVQITNWHRFTGKTIGAFLGLVPSESSSGQTRSLGSITKTGNSHARRLLVEAGWHHHRDYLPSTRSVMHARWAKAPLQAQLRGQAGNERLHKQGVAFTARKKRPGRNGRSSPTSRSRVNPPAGAGRWPSWTANPPRTLIVGAQVTTNMWSDPLSRYEQHNPNRKCDARSLDQRHLSSRTLRPAVTNPRIFPRKREGPPA